MNASRLNASSVSATSDSRIRARMVIHAYDALISALEAEEIERSQEILTGLIQVLALDTAPGLAVSLAGLYGNLRELVKEPSQIFVVLHAVRHLRDVWAHAVQIDENSFKTA